MASITQWDRADYQSALTVWLDAASTGDAQAMNYVGEIFEQGLGRASDYVMAKYWYERAVAADFKPAMVNLASLYDTGRGVAVIRSWQSIYTDRPGAFPTGKPY